MFIENKVQCLTYNQTSPNTVLNLTRADLRSMGCSYRTWHNLLQYPGDANHQ